MDKIIIAVIIIVIIVYAVQFLFSAALLAIPMIIAGGIGVRIYRLAIYNKIIRAGNRALYVETRQGAPSLVVSSKRVKERSHALDLWGIFIGLIVAIIIALLFGDVIITPQSLPMDLRGVGSWVIGTGVALGLTGTFFLIANWSCEHEIRNVANKHIKVVNQSFKTAISNLETIESRIASIVQSISISSPPPTRMSEIYEIFNEAGEELIHNPKAASTFSQSVIDMACNDEQYLRMIFDELQNVRNLHQRAVEQVSKSGFRSLMKPLDEIYDYLESQQISDLVYMREFEELRSQLCGIESELLQIFQQAQKVEEADQSVNDSPTWDASFSFVAGDKMSRNYAYQRLSAKPGDDKDRLKEIYHALLRIYHPDKIILKDGSETEKFQLIQEAFQFLQSEGLA
jgi:hypothetical protein